MISSCCLLYVLRRSKVISFNANESIATSDSSKTLVSIQTLIHTSPLALTYLLYMLATMESVRGVNVPMYTTLRRTTVVFTMIVEYIFARQRYTHPILGSVALIVLGAFIAGSRDLSFDSHGYLIVFLSNFTTAIYLATIARVGKSSGLNSFGLMWCNGILCAPVLLVWTLFRGDLEMTMDFPYLFSPGFLMVMLLSCILAFFLNYSIFLNTTLNSALTQTICGNLKVTGFSIYHIWIGSEASSNIPIISLMPIQNLAHIVLDCQETYIPYWFLLVYTCAHLPICSGSFHDFTRLVYRTSFSFPTCASDSCTVNNVNVYFAPS
ncbi:Nucleotide/sugar transporter family protein [Perilla frutescens var. hirtella]|uniref:Nucleotide/sugar transporter family protein n=1 Tax=Perilla frutescens var. hirtella TaxID=608512 RepID=A0AAD4JC76_PERFH|nr:Nucleotide/sugar transporter family protein [Perilla frutescens var. hirtella]